MKELIDSEKRGLIALSLVKGLKELHSIGYTHGHLRPRDIVMNLKKLDVRLVSFKYSQPKDAPFTDPEEYLDIYTPKKWSLM